MKVRQRSICHTCRARKLGCDGQSPSCSQCLKSRRKCGGYQYDLIFAEPVTVATTKPNASTHRPVSAAKPPRRKRGALPDIPNRPCPPPAGHGKALSWPLQDTLSLVAQNFLPANALKDLGVMAPIAAPSRVCGSWIEVVPDLKTTGPHGMALSSSIRAFAVAIMSYSLPDAASTIDALAAHGSALSSLKQALTNRQGDGSNELSAAIMFLFLSEILLPVNRSSGIHIGGLSRLMQSRGPEYYSTGIPHKIFIGCRPSLVIQSICTRKAFFLEAHEWCTVPFQTTPAQPLQSLMSIGTCIPAILETMDQLGLASESCQVSVCIDKLQNTMKRLDSWHRSYAATLLSTNGYDCAELSTREHIWFPDISVANSLTHYWAFWVICAEYAMRLRSSLPWLELSSDELLEQQAAVRAKAMLIMKSVKFLTEEDVKLFGATSLCLVAKVAYEHFEQACDPDSIAMCDRMVQHIRSRGYHYLNAFIQSDSKVLRLLPCMGLGCIQLNGQNNSPIFPQSSTSSDSFDV